MASLCRYGFCALQGITRLAPVAAQRSSCTAVRRVPHEDEVTLPVRSSCQKRSQWWRGLLFAPLLACRSRRNLRLQSCAFRGSMAASRDFASRRVVVAAAKRSISNSRLKQRRPAEALPPQSIDGGNAKEFEEYWSWYHKPRRLADGWIERRTHPQIGVVPYWYNADSDETVFEAPSAGEVGQEDASSLDEEPLSIDGPAGELSVKELRAALQTPDRGAGLGLTDEALAQRACHEYEIFTPRVLSWHDYQYNTFWFFIDDRNDRKGSKGTKGASGFFNSKFQNERKPMFAHRSFFEATAELATKRLRYIHPINLVYLLWSFTRGGVCVPEFFNAAAEYMCNGLLPSMDRCALGTMVLAFAKQQLRHERLFRMAAQELQRPVRARSLAPRNFQNVMIAYRWYGPQEALTEELAKWLPRLLDKHEATKPKLRNRLLFPYTCIDGSVVLADAFRINGLNVVAGAFVQLNAESKAAEDMFKAIVDYIRRSERSPAWMREPGDVCAFAKILAEAVIKGWPEANTLLEELKDTGLVQKGAPQRELERLEATLRRGNLPALRTP
eukprot:TRINITY_DN52095_c0_g1_i1.p1 TRINITY_DN52095_c0_g1~~TRINITY_DN52095_c0_g1_i1.p1  ORF type:complete len:571 (+),score=120.79 TRINITY_DN52095_c0_g1_i1:44-1714(+)